jgi:hypothetical protein
MHFLRMSVREDIQCEARRYGHTCKVGQVFELDGKGIEILRHRDSCTGIRTMMTVFIIFVAVGQTY